MSLLLRLLLHLWALPVVVGLVALVLVVGPGRASNTPGRAASEAGPGPGSVADPPAADRYVAALALGEAGPVWEALCPELQRIAELRALEEHARQRRVENERLGAQVTWEHVASHGRVGGGEIRFYVVTRTYAQGADQTAYIVWTQPSGCVERIE